jgi:hypothetical protein
MVYIIDILMSVYSLKAIFISYYNLILTFSIIIVPNTPK